MTNSLVKLIYLAVMIILLVIGCDTGSIDPINKNGITSETSQENPTKPVPNHTSDNTQVPIETSTAIVPIATATPTPIFIPTPTPTPTPIPTPMPLIKGLPSVSKIVSQVKPSVVSIRTESNIEQCDFFFGCRNVEQEAQGTGVLFDESGLIVTNNHVVNGATEINVFLDDGRSFIAKIRGTDPASDLAVIEIPKGTYDAPSFADPDSLQIGDWVIAIGNALALPGGPTVTLGIVGALDRYIDTEGGRLFNMIQTDAAINQGNSGGPLIDLEGDIVGINTARTSQGEGIGFAVSSFTVVPVISSILEHGKVVFGWMGVGVTDVTPVIVNQENLSVNKGVLITRIDMTGPAEEAGILVGDVITAFEDIEVTTVKQLQKVVRGYDIGMEAKVTVSRGDDILDLNITLEEQPRGS